MAAFVVQNIGTDTVVSGQVEFMAGNQVNGDAVLKQIDIVTVDCSLNQSALNCLTCCISRMNNPTMAMSASFVR